MDKDVQRHNFDGSMDYLARAEAMIDDALESLSAQQA